MYWFKQLIVDMMEVIKVAGTLVFRMIFEYSPIGQILKEALKVICAAVDWVVNEIWKGFMPVCPIIEAVLPPLVNIFIDFLEGLQAFLAAFGAGGAIQGLIDSSKGFKANVEVTPTHRHPPLSCFVSDTLQRAGPSSATSGSTSPASRAPTTPWRTRRSPCRHGAGPGTSRPPGTRRRSRARGKGCLPQITGNTCVIC
mmetsp:Transcript_34296/g.84383  ORF Transcript_34296/g.84383 Transcript_34296/m.84383 type:complete len:198 (-) Transcript_34296:614-1207(-)